MEKVKLLDKGIIELPEKVCKRFGLEKGTEFDIFFDSDTLISGLLWDGNEARIIEKAENKEIKLFISPKLIEELGGVLKRKKFCRRLGGKEYTVDKAVLKIALIATLIKPAHKINII